MYESGWMTVIKWDMPVHLTMVQFVSMRANVKNAWSEAVVG
jgi:hypothetical protein